MRRVLNYAGGKWAYSTWIVSFFPPHKMYLEPYFGSGAAFFSKPPSKMETINDIDGQVVNYFKAIREHPEELARAIYLTPYARDEYLSVLESHAGEQRPLSGDCVEDARRFAVRCFQTFGGKLSDRCGWKNTKKASGPNNPLIWQHLPDAILAAAQRLKNVQIENMDAIRLIEAYNQADCLIYADPPYLGELRNHKRMYRCEMMEEDQHERLLSILLNHKGPVVISGYESDLYNDMLRGWYRYQHLGVANSGQSRIEMIWANFESQIMFA